MMIFAIPLMDGRQSRFRLSIEIHFVGRLRVMDARWEMPRRGGEGWSGGAWVGSLVVRAMPDRFPVGSGRIKREKVDSIKASQAVVGQDSGALEKGAFW